MNKTKLLAIAFVALLAVTGVTAAVSGNAPVNTAADEQHADERSENADDRNDAADDRDARDDAGPAPDGVAADRGERGPPADLPEQAPDHVSEVHGLIGQFLDGGLDVPLGDAISDATPDDETESEEDARDGDARAANAADGAEDVGGEDDADNEDDETDPDQ